MDEHNNERDEGSIAMLEESRKASPSRSSKIPSNSASGLAESSTAITPPALLAPPACCDVALACLDTSLVCCTDEECSDGEQLHNNKDTNQDNEDCPQCETAAKEDAATPCTDPGCQLLEWDEQAVDELLRCCCSSDTAHSHRSFATPYTAAIRATTPPIDNTYKHPAPPILPNSSINHGRPPDDGFAFLPPSSSSSSYNPYIPHSHTTHTHSHLHPPQLLPDSRSEASTSHSSSTNTFSFSSPALSSLSSGAHTVPTHTLKPLQLPSPTAIKVYRCQWSLCPATFQDKESLIGHVNASHLMSAEAQPVEEIRKDNANGASFDANNAAVAGDDSFENTLKCLWDSCSASLPILQVSPAEGTGNGSSSCLKYDTHMLNNLNNGDTAASAGGKAALHTNCGGAHSHNMQAQPSLPLQDAPTATLVRHLLQDHLHIPLDVLSLLSPSLGVSNPLSVPSTNHSFKQIPLPPDHDRQNDAAPFTNSLPPASTMASPSSIAAAANNYAENAQSQVFNHHSMPPQYPQHPHTMNSPIYSGPPSVASGRNCNSPAFPNFPQQQQQQNLVSLQDHTRQNDLRSLAKHARNASLDSLASSVLEASYGLAQQQQQQQQSWNSHSRNGSSMSSEFYGRAMTGMDGTKDLSTPPNGGSGSGNEVHNCGWKDCGASFSTTSALMEHISSSHIGSGKSVYYCHWVGCERAHSGRGFNQRQKIQRHLRTHVGDKPFLCPFPGCTSKFSESTTLNQHIRTQHTSEKPFKCDFEGCGKSFALQSALTIHKRTHSGEKPFKCPVEGCGMRFAESSNLSKHVKTHRNNGTEDVEVEVEQKKTGRKRRSIALDDNEGGEEEEKNNGVFGSYGMHDGTISGKSTRRQRSRI